MKKILIAATLFLTFVPLAAQWKPAGNKIKTAWAEKIDPNNVLGEYPRPIMERTDWKNLNGLWDYAIRPYGNSTPDTFDGQLLVPFAVESSLSGVMKEVGSKNELWYRNDFEVPADWNGKNLLLHFGAVDWKADIWLNDVKIGSHSGGYTPFSFDVTPFLKDGLQKMTVRVWDPNDEGPQPRGKQVNKPEGIWYTPVTGIWQTVWLEPVPEKRIESLRILPNMNGSVDGNTPVSNPDDAIYVNEGPQALAHGDKLHIVYSASGCWPPYYALGLLTMDTNSDPMDPAYRAR